MIPDVTRAYLPVTRTVGRPPFGDAPRPPNVPAAEGTTPPNTVAPRAPGPASLPEGTPGRPTPGSVQEAAGPGDLPDHLLTWLTTQVAVRAHYAHIQAILETDPARSAIQAVNHDR